MSAMTGNPFDAGQTLTSGGYRWSLATFRQHYTLNVLGTRAILHEAWCKEFPEAAVALEESDKKLTAWEKVAGDPEKVGALMEMVGAMAVGKSVKEAVHVPPEHTHSWGETETGEAEGHTHKIEDGKCVEAMGHTHDAPKAAAEKQEA